MVPWHACPTWTLSDNGAVESRRLMRTRATVATWLPGGPRYRGGWAGVALGFAAWASLVARRLGWQRGKVGRGVGLGQKMGRRGGLAGCASGAGLGQNRVGGPRRERGGSGP